MSLLQFVRHYFDLEKDVLHVSTIQKPLEIAITVQKIRQMSIFEIQNNPIVGLTLIANKFNVNNH